MTISPFLKDLQDRFENQYLLTLEPGGEKGVQPVKVRSETPGLKVEAPTYVYNR